MFWTGFITGVICLMIGIVAVIIYGNWKIEKEYGKHDN